MTMPFRTLAAQAAADGAISADDILALRRSAWGDGAIGRSEAEALCAINDGLAERTPEWIDYYVEALLEHMLSGGEPRGYIGDSDAEWLIGRLARDGRLESAAELELVVKLLERSINAPEPLRRLALAEVEKTVLTGSGATRSGRDAAPGVITSEECALLRRLIFAQGGDRPAAVGQEEAAMLYRLKDATLGADNAPEWTRLFVQGVGNYLTGFSWSAAPSRQRAAQLESFMNQNRPHLGHFLAAMAKADIGGGLRGALADKPARDLDGDVSAAAVVTMDEERWLTTRIDADGQLDPLERALLDFLAEEARG